MNNLVFSNFLHRPMRTVVSVLGIAVGVLLIVFTVGLANGSMREKVSREANVNAEIFFCPGGPICVGGSGAFRLPLSMIDEVKKVDGVKSVVPLGQKMISVSDSKTGQRMIDGINFEDYASIVNIKIEAGRKFEEGADEVIVDTAFMRQMDFKIGGGMKMWDRNFEIVGSYEPAAGARVKVPLTTMQKQLSTEDKATAFLVKIKEGRTPEEMGSAIKEAFPDNHVVLTKDMEELYLQSIPALNIFLDVIIGVAAIISSMVILLTMYTTVSERTRQIGIMKSLGMSNVQIVWIITKEALLISFCGIVTGIALTYILQFLLSYITTLTVEMKLNVILTVFLVGLLGGAIGALYPALRAANLDAVEALNYE
ncbi:MAG: ABC transporter permease [Pyrinomonadaceae bacterium]|nr:ABC transporter permease [Pyrinomonadaceae bacterium]